MDTSEPPGAPGSGGQGSPGRGSGCPFAGRVALVTGSARGIGAATARTLADRGATVVLHGREPSENLSTIANALDAPFVTFDVRSRDAVFAGIESVLQQQGHIDVLVNMAGQATVKPFLETDESEWEDEFRVNVFGTVWCCQAAIPSMLANRYGRIVNVASMRGLSSTASPRSTQYSASKSAIVGLTASLAKQFAPDVIVNAIAPGFVSTDMSQHWPPDLVVKAESALARRIAGPAEIAGAVAFLAGEDASFMFGETIRVDGGYGMSDK